MEPWNTKYFFWNPHFLVFHLCPDYKLDLCLDVHLFQLSFTLGPITIEFLRSFAKLIGKEWYNLARGLRLEHVRIQSIAQQNKRSSLEDLVYDLLLTWLKRSCHSTDKVISYLFVNVYLDVWCTIYMYFSDFYI